MTINSLYSFYWDVAKDWDLTLFSRHRSSTEYPFGLRPTRLIGPPLLYYTVIVIDFVLRCTWSLKLSIFHLEHLDDFEGVIFLLEVLEVCRRWMWVFLRVEAEHVRARAPGNILLHELPS